MSVIKPELSVHTLVENANLKSENERLNGILNKARLKINSIPNIAPFYLDPLKKLITEIRDILNGE